MRSAIFKVVVGVIKREPNSYGEDYHTGNKAPTKTSLAWNK